MNETENVEALISYLSGMLEDIILDYRKNWQRDRELGYPGYEGVREDDVATQDECRELRREEIARLNTILPKLEDSYINKLQQSWGSLVDKIRQTARKQPDVFRQIMLLLQMQLQIYSFNNSSSQHNLYPPDFNGSDSNSKDRNDATKSLNKCTAGMAPKETDISCQYYEQGINIDRQYTEQQSLLLNGLLPKGKELRKDEELKETEKKEYEEAAAAQMQQGKQMKTLRRHAKQKSDSGVLEKLKSISKKQIRHQQTASQVISEKKIERLIDAAVDFGEDFGAQ